VVTVPAAPIDAADPGDPRSGAQRQFCSRTAGHFAYNLVARNKLRTNRWQISFGNVQVGPANSAGEDSQEHIAGLQFRPGNLLNLKEWLGRPAARDKDGSLHGELLPTWDADSQATVPSCLFILAWVAGAKRRRNTAVLRNRSEY
jgi:hypothetical protein